MDDYLSLCTDKEVEFIKRLAAHGEKARAAREAGYPEKSAGNAASRMLKRERVLKALQQYRDALNNRTGQTPDDVRAALWANHVNAAAKGNIAASNRALELVGKINGAFDKPEGDKPDATDTGPQLSDLELARLASFAIRTAGPDALEEPEQPQPAANPPVTH